MACRFLYTNIWDVGTITAATEASGYPGSNTQHRWHLKSWRSMTITQDQWVKSTLDSQKSAQAVVIFANNLDLISSDKKLYFQGSNDNFSSVPLNLAWQSPSYCQVQFFNQQSYQYYRVYILANSSRQSFFSIGRIFCGTYFEPQRYFADRSIKLIDPSPIHYSESGQIVTLLKTKYREMTYTFFVNDSDKAGFELLYQKVGNWKEFFFCEDTSNPNNTTYYVRIAGFSMRQIHKNYWEIQITLEQLR